MYTSYARSVLDLVGTLTGYGIRTTWDTLDQESLIGRARNRIVARFLKSGFSHLLFLDADVGFNAADIVTMLRAPFDVVAGAYPVKEIDWNRVEKAVKDGVPLKEVPAAAGRYVIRATTTTEDSLQTEIIMTTNGSRFVRVHEAGTGCMVIRRSALGRFIDQYRSEIEYVSDYHPMGETHHAVFHADRDPLALKEGRPARYLSEDYWFCRKWTMMGGEIHLLMDAKLSHTGLHVYRGDVASLFSVNTTRAA
jgi:hypothetical protein